jgi:hypothetical protein
MWRFYFSYPVSRSIGATTKTSTHAANADRFLCTYAISATQVASAFDTSVYAATSAGLYTTASASDTSVYTATSAGLYTTASASDARVYTTHR